MSLADFAFSNTYSCPSLSDILLPLPVFNTKESFVHLENALEWEGWVFYFIGIPMAMADFSGRYSCSHGLYMISKGVVGSRPILDTAFLSDVVDRLLVD